MNQPIRILQIVTIMNLGGLESFLMTIYRNIDRSKVQFDFLVHRQERGAFDDEIEILGGKIFRLNPIRPTRFFQYQKELKLFFFDHKEYRIIHSHLNENSAIILSVAKKMGITVRIAHSHAKATAGPYKLLREFIKTRIDPNSTLNLACSEDAGKWLYGGKDFEVFKNSVDVDKFKFPQNSEKIKTLKDDLSIENKDFVMGLVARFSSTKNHVFLIDIFNEYHKLNQDSKLLLVGDGELRLEIENLIKKFNLQEKVIFTGNVNNPQDYLSLMDIFVMTSFNEGLGIVLIEAQCNGLPILMSDTMPEEIDLTDLTYRESLNSSPKHWANKINEIKELHKDDNREGYETIIKDKNYDISSNAQKLIDIYMSNYQESLKN